MDKSMGFTILVLVAILIPCVVTQRQQKYDHSKRTIDFRYPDYIVDPRPPCLSEGFFQHPRNCSWFYRCHDIRNIGAFRTFYFECAPGTVFSDALDVCVAGHHSSASCGDGSNGGIVPVGDGDDDTSEAENGDTSDEGNGDTSDEGNGDSDEGSGDTSDEGDGIPDTDNGAGDQDTDEQDTDEQNTDEQDTTEDEDTDDSSEETDGTSTDTGGSTDGSGCYDFMIKCKEYICPATEEGTASIGAVCDKAYKECANGKKTHFCEEPQLYNMATKKCINNPVDDGCVEAPDPSATTTTTTTTTPAPPLTHDSCYDSMKGCSHYFCPIENNQFKDEYLCTSATRTCKDGVITSFCLETEYYDFDTQKCVEPPEQRQCRPKDEPSSETLNISFFVECSAENTRPQNSKFEEYFCQDYDTCISFRQTETMLCRSYLQCVLNGDDWSVTVMNCPRRLLYSYALDKCIAPGAC